MTELKKMFLISPELFDRLHNKQSATEQDLTKKMQRALFKKKRKDYDTLLEFRRYQTPYLKSIQKKREPISIPILEGKQPHQRPVFKTARRRKRVKKLDLPDDITEQFGNIAESYMSLFENKSHSIDNVFGIRKDENQFKIGEKPVFVNENNVIVDNEAYEGTPGLWELLTKKHVDYSKVSKSDLENYKKILIQSGAHLDSRGRIKSSKGEKYKQVISQLLSKKWTQVK